MQTQEKLTKYTNPITGKIVVGCYDGPPLAYFEEGEGPEADIFIKQCQNCSTRYDQRTGQYIPTINGVDTSPTSFDRDQALLTAFKQIKS